jgi:hypothetical protein
VACFGKQHQTYYSVHFVGVKEKVESEEGQNLTFDFIPQQPC